LLVGLISDTHIAFTSEKLPPQIKDAFRGVELILHAGDIWIPRVLDELETIAPVKAAWGDDDLQEDLGSDRRMIKGRALFLDGVTLWLTHIKPHYELLVPEEEDSSPGSENPPDVAVYGHTHVGRVEHFKGVLLVNPGSATWPRYIQQLGTVALLSINSGEVEARIVQLE